MEVVLVNYVVWLSHVIYLTQYICAQDIAHITGKHRCKYTIKSSYFNKLSLLLLLLNVNRPKAFLLGRLTSVQSFQQPPSDRFLHILSSPVSTIFFMIPAGEAFSGLSCRELCHWCLERGILVLFSTVFFILFSSSDVKNLVCIKDDDCTENAVCSRLDGSTQFCICDRGHVMFRNKSGDVCLKGKIRAKGKLRKKKKLEQVDSLQYGFFVVCRE